MGLEPTSLEVRALRHESRSEGSLDKATLMFAPPSPRKGWGRGPYCWKRAIRQHTRICNWGRDPWPLRWLFPYEQGSLAM